MKILHHLLPMLVVVISLSACAESKAPTFGQTIKNESAATKAIGKQWLKGDKLTQEGLKLTADGKEDISRAKKLDKRGQNKIEKGENLVKKGNSLKKESENDYNSSLLNESKKAKTEY